MALNEMEMKELREHTKHFLAGKISAEQAQIVIGFYSQVEKRMRLQVQILGMAEKYGKRFYNRVVKANLIGNGTVIDLSPGEIEEENVLCPLKDAHITRAECLDYSGNTDNIDKCEGCDVGIANKKLIMGNTPMFTV